MDVLWGGQDDPTAKARDGGHGLGREGGQCPRPVRELAWHRCGAARAHLPRRTRANRGTRPDILVGVWMEWNLQ